MSALLCYVSTYLALTVALANANQMEIPAYVKKMKCDDCSMNKDCEVKSTGFFCPYVNDRIQIHYDRDGNFSKGLGYLADCMLPHYYFYNKQSIAHVCCFWSPIIGCQQVRNVKAIKAHCGACANWNWSPDRHYVGCPCQEREEVMKRKRKKGKKGSCTKVTHFGIVPMILIHLVQQIFATN